MVEDRLNEEVKTLLESKTEEYERSMMDYGRVFQMVKSKLVRERGLILQKSMKISRDKINHISSLIVKDFSTRDELDYKVDLNDLRLDITRTMTDILLLDDKADKEARRVMNTYKNAPREGSPEWDIIYQKHFDEFMNKQRI